MYYGSMPLAPGYFLTWHTYGTWLHGDRAGSVDREHAIYGTPRLAADDKRFARAREALCDPPLTLNEMSRMLVDNIVREHCRIRSWNLAALSVRSNHIHVVIRDPEVKPEPIVKQLKEWGTRKLREHRIIAPRQHAWADHASTIYLYEPGSLAKAVVYVLEMQDHRPEGHGREDWREKLGIGEP